MDRERAYDLAIRDMIQTVLAETDYRPRAFMQMVATHGAKVATLRLLHTEPPPEGFTTLWEIGRLDLTAEAHMLRPEFKQLFTETDRNAARKRLRAYGYYSGED